MHCSPGAESYGLSVGTQGLGLGAYQALFEQHCITLESVFSLDNTALKAMQLPSEARGKLLALTAPCASRATATCAHGAVDLTAVASVVASGASQAAHGASLPSTTASSGKLASPDAAKLKTKIEELEEQLEMQDMLLQPLITKERTTNDSLMDARKAALQAAAQGFPVPVRDMGLLNELVMRKAARAGRIDEIGASELQEVLLRDPGFRPVRVRQIEGTERHEQVPNYKDPRLMQVATKHGQDVAEAVMTAFLELDEWNPSGRYTVRIPWDEINQRELQPAEVTDLIMRAASKPRPTTSNRSSRWRH